MKFDLKEKKKLVIKIGSSLLVSEGKLREKWLKNFTANIADLVKKNFQIIIVSSGAIALGRQALKTVNKKLSLEEKQAAAAIGQIHLMGFYRDFFFRQKLQAAQILLTASDCNVRDRYLNCKNTVETLLKNSVIPIINENDSVAVDEIRIGDNDRLAARVAQMADADLLILFSDIDGLYEKNPRTHKNARACIQTQRVSILSKFCATFWQNFAAVSGIQQKILPKNEPKFGQKRNVVGLNTGSNLITEVFEITKEIENMAGSAGSLVGTGGMITKISAAKMLKNFSCDVIITCGTSENALKNFIDGKQNFTIFYSKKKLTKQRKHWLSGFLNAKGEVIVNECAAEMLRNKKISLLPIGVIAAKGDFKKGDAIFIKDKLDNHIASGISNYDIADLKKVFEKKSAEVKKILGKAVKPELVHIDDLVVI